MSVIAYDRPVRDFIAGLDATGHVSAGAYRKTSVTLHHNGGRLSLQGCLDVWKTREASAHFDVDGAGNVGQYVRVNGYAWAVGNTEGNCSTISIEQANSANAPSWTVATATWQSAARLAGWLFARVIGARPNAGNFFVHSHWYATSCAGPYISSVWNPIMAAAQAAYDAFTGGHTPPAPPVTPPVTHPVSTAPTYPLPAGSYFGPKTGGANSVSGYYSHQGDLQVWQRRMAARGWTIGVDGLYGDQTAGVARQFQSQCRLAVDGLIGPATWSAAWTARIT